MISRREKESSTFDWWTDLHQIRAIVLKHKKKGTGEQAKPWVHWSLSKSS